ncbi:hypothetical protein VOLCADRAFT_104649 [Volvox carteri f. nagariensis]|uniref:Uncharacterized protein n=1 Tax=Volvox carteri f. nagariensis TaxID=3068 RepID=D8TVK5_VOLCA|nr:uncharacterized protein VOLCADRAFT_104649 [Volvox carteri f. nagariensis]EFJ48471.1 hypothetical protein VOLCADRAFT_104649 [Volvox carteri f. nagariensis]|eukprot:XP_002950270.1 hypothetical protein VOLCADRAFT_104649 [Volvox carteri f. nagariensis]
MALVPYRVSGPAADQRATERLLQFPGGITLRLLQWPTADRGGAVPKPMTAAAATDVTVTTQPAAAGLAPGGARSSSASTFTDSQLQQQQQLSEPLPYQPQRQGPPLSSLANVGMVVWQAGFLLADFLLREAPECVRSCRGSGGGGGWGGATTISATCSDWRSLTVVDLGTGSGVVGIALALAGAQVYLTDLPHVVPLAAANVAVNCDPRVHRACVCSYRWGDDPAVASMESQAIGATGIPDDGLRAAAPAPSPLAGVEPDLITAADVLYHEDLLQPLMTALQRLSAPHTVSYVSYRVRQGGEVAAFLARAEAAGFAAEKVPAAALHEEYRYVERIGGPSAGGGLPYDSAMEGSDGNDGVGPPDLAVECGDARQLAPGMYGILRLCRRDPAVAAAGSTYGRQVE